MTIPVEFGVRWFGSDETSSITVIEQAVSFYLACRGLPKPQPWIIARDSDYPATGYVSVGTVEDYTVMGASGIATSHLQIFWFDATYNNCLLGTQQIRDKLNGFTGVVGSVNIYSAWRENVTDPQIVLRDGDEKPYWYQQSDYQFLWNIGIPNL